MSDQVFASPADLVDEGFRLGRHNPAQAEQALALFDRAIVIDPTLAAAWSGRGLALQQLGRLKEALDSFNQAIDLGPSKYTWYNRGVLLGQGLEDHQAAEADFKQALAIDDRFIEAWLNLSVAQKHLGRHLESKQSWLKVLDINPSLASLDLL